MEVAPLEEENVEPPGYWQRDVRPRPPLRVSRIACDGESIAFALRERIRRSADPRPPEHPGGSSRLYPRIYSYEPTGELALKLTNVNGDLGVRTTWKDGKKLPLEQQLDGFVAYLSTVALAFKLKREDDERHRLAAIEAQRRHLEEEHRRREEEERRRKGPSGSRNLRRRSRAGDGPRTSAPTWRRLCTPWTTSRSRRNSGGDATSLPCCSSRPSASIHSPRPAGDRSPP